MKTSQSERLIQFLRGGWRTTGDMLMTGISVCPWKRVSEGAHLYLRKGEHLRKIRYRDGSMLYRVTRTM